VVILEEYKHEAECEGTMGNETECIILRLKKQAEFRPRIPQY